MVRYKGFKFSLKKRSLFSIVLTWSLGLVVFAVVLIASIRVLLFALGSIMRFWYNYTQSDAILWALTFVSFLVLVGFGYLLVVRRREYLARDEYNDSHEDVYGGFSEE